MQKLFVLVAIMIPSYALAQSVYLTEQAGPYEIVPVEQAAGVSTSFLGELADFPIMYELTSDDPFTLSASVRQVGTQELHPFSLIVIRQNDRGGGVSEVGRMNVAATEWERLRDDAVGLTFAHSPSVTSDVEAGTYRIEVSTPENSGKYQLLIHGNDADTSYFSRLADIRLTQDFFGYSVVAMLGSQLIYVPLLILLLIYVSYRLARAYLSRGQSQLN